MITSLNKCSEFFELVRERYNEVYTVLVSYDNAISLFTLGITMGTENFEETFSGDKNIIFAILDSIFNTFHYLDRDEFSENLYAVLSESTGFDEFVFSHSDEEIQDSKLCHDIYNFIEVLAEDFLCEDDEMEYGVRVGNYMVMAKTSKGPFGVIFNN